MSLIDDYWDLEDNVSALEAVRKSDHGREFEIYRSLIAKGRVLLPYLTTDGIAFGPSRFLGYKGNTVAKHAEREHRDGRETTPRIRQVLAKEFGYTTWNTPDDVAEDHFVRFCSSLSVTPDNASRTFWITPEVGDWLADHSANEQDTISDKTGSDASLEDSVRNDKSLPETTRKSIIKSRVGQGLFRRRVLQAYGNCMITRLAEHRLLIASHIKPWRDCCHDPNECLNPDNALLLSPTWDALFDKGFLSFSDEGQLLLSTRLSKKARRALGIQDLSVALTKGQASYMRHHRSMHGFEDSV
ncbi:HNH endonuclease signature motif containing protein [Paracoccus sp. WLY502]|uniref:HNH endonuclease n=1 Tax=Paracoccus yibinensis TaxID=3068891 RepID=UPI0027963D0B|nr:HNH endonuclease signature motif containing protein [Paracoccus sp. WLY502]MDQ1902364.1 HNH endonuclease signature motif containing protein [Paracoccus sp. WLY502]